MRNYLFLLLLILLSPSIFCSKQSYFSDIKFQTLTVSDGLQSNNVACVTQDSKGFIWIGTIDGGISRYDGSDFFYYTTEDTENSKSIKSNYAWRFYQDMSNNLWIITWGGGISRYIEEQDSFITYVNDPDDTNSLSSNLIWGVLVDSRDILWVATENGLNRMDPQTNSFKHYFFDIDDENSITHNIVTGVIEGADGTIWISTYGGGINRYNFEEDNFKYIQTSSNFQWDIYEDEDGRIWIGSESGLEVYYPKENRFKLYKHDPDDNTSISGTTVTSVTPHSEGFIMLGTDGYGANIFDPETEKFIRLTSDPTLTSSISDNRVWDVFEDSNRMLWVSTFSGLNTYHPAYKRFTNYSNNSGQIPALSGNSIEVISSTDKNIIWIGSRDGGLNRYDLTTNTFKSYRYDKNNPSSLIDNAVMDIEQDSNGNLWIATYKGLDFFNLDTEEFIHLNMETQDEESIIFKPILDVEIDNSGNIWTGNYGFGLDKFDPVTRQVTNYRFSLSDNNSLISDWITSMLFDSNGYLWIGTESGLSKFNPETDTFSNYRHDVKRKNSLSSSNIYSIYEHDNGTIWIGTSNGLNRYIPENDGFICYSVKYGFEGNMIASITNDLDGNLWLGTNRGITYFNCKSGDVRNFNNFDGLGSNQYRQGSVYRANNGVLYFGGTQGFTTFNPSTLVLNDSLPEVYITQFTLFNEPVDIFPESILTKRIDFKENITLTYDNYIFGFSFAALNYIYPLKNRYSYMLDGVDKNWITVNSSNRNASYTNLDPGSYIFRVKGSNNDGLWNPEETVLNIRILPPWWETLWARIIYVILIISFVIVVINNRISSINKVKTKLESDLKKSNREIRDIQNELIESAKMASLGELVAGVTHEINTPLSIGITSSSYINDRSDDMLKKIDKASLSKKDLTDFLEDSKNSTEIITTNLKHASKLIKSFKLVAVDQSSEEKREFKIAEYINEIIISLSPKLKKTDHKIFINYEEDFSIYSYPGSIYQIISNLIINSLFHGFTDIKEGEINIDISKTDGYLKIIYRDSGCGISPDHIDKIFDPFFTTKRGFGGSGLGMNISYNLVTQTLKGQMKCIDTEMKGALFEILIPIES